ncbi:PAS domain S-box protein [uncultured Methanoregula sp.]|uniref:PAS domain S-box protein n=1 Tax=uncultured Methanoregula sp. TaxID=1005933 RepID=UPI002AAC0B65|nr:PAS domain S-box protein [uncultured Methanoregula sp.]
MTTEKGDELRFLIIAAASIGAILTTVFSLTHGIFEIFPFLYILPIILVVYFYPSRAVLFSLGISLMYISLIYLFGFANPDQIAIATAWFAIFVTIGVVVSSYATKLQQEKIRIRQILNNSQDGIFCFDIRTGQVLEINAKCTQWLRYERSELLGTSLAMIWSSTDERESFIKRVKTDPWNTETEGLFRAKDGAVLRFLISAVLVLPDRILCSAIDITGSKIVDEEIRKTLDDLEEQVRARTAHLEEINEKLRAEILERRRTEQKILEKTMRSAPDEEERE